MIPYSIPPGVRIVESALVSPVAKIAIRDSFEWCDEESRAAINAWFLETFGTRPAFYIADLGELGIGIGLALVTSPGGAGAIRGVSIEG